MHWTAPSLANSFAQIAHPHVDFKTLPPRSSVFLQGYRQSEPSTGNRMGILALGREWVSETLFWVEGIRRSGYRIGTRTLWESVFPVITTSPPGVKGGKKRGSESMLVTQKVSGSVAVMCFCAGVELQLLCECHCFMSTIKATSTCHYHLSCPCGHRLDWPCDCYPL